jgi:NitT/TauT family transport system substrate-binding protein
MKLRNLLWAHALLTAVLALSGCGNGGSAPGDATSTQSAATNSAAAPSELKKVTVGYLPNIVMPQPLLGITDGQYARRVPGVEFVGKDFPAGPAVMEALRSGVVDIAYTGPYPPIKAYGKDRDMVLLAGSATGGTELVVAKDSPIKTVKDLKGKAIGVNQFASTVDAVVRYNLIEAGLNPEKDVKIIPIPPAQQADALKRNEVAAVAAPAPWPSVVAINGNGRPLLDWKQILANGDYLAGVAFTTKKFADKNPNFVRQFVAAHRAITDELNADRTKGDARVLAAWSKVTKKTLKPEVAEAAFKTIQFTNEAKEEGLRRDADIAYKVGILRKKADLTGFVYQG